MTTPQEALNQLIRGNALSYDAMRELMHQIMAGVLTPIQSAGILVALRSKGETVTEIAAAASVMRELAATVQVQQREHLIDTCGTGGDGLHTFNISTTAAFVVAAAGGRVAKHGNRSVSSSSGSADVLEALGVNLQLTPAQVGQCIDQIGVGFMFAPNHHSAMKNVGPVRRELGVRTLFNILGPLTNPAGAQHQLMGVFHPDLVGIQARVLQTLGSQQVMIVHGKDGLDEISLMATTLVAELKGGVVAEYELDPRSLGFAFCEPSALQVSNATESAQVIRDVLANVLGPCRDIVLLNAGAAIYTAQLADDLPSGIDQARQALASGAAGAKLEALIALTQTMGSAA